MFDLLRCIKSDFYKLRHTPIPWMHLLIPLAGALMFLAYYTVSSWDAITKISGYFETLAITFPLLIGLITGIVIGQEEQAGNFQILLCGIKSKSIAYLSKLIVLLLLGSFSIALALGSFGLVFQTVPQVVYLKAMGALILGNIFLYILHIFISLQFGKGASIGLGIIGSLISALMLTGLGDNIWHWVPWAWGVRFCDYIVWGWVYPSSSFEATMAIQQGISAIYFLLGIAFFCSLLWFNKWEGRKSYD